MKAVWNGNSIAESDKIKKVEGNIYFPPQVVNREYLKESQTTYKCAWKGIARYYHLDVDGQTLEDAAWYYPEPSQAALNIKDHIAFGKDVEVTND